MITIDQSGLLLQLQNIVNVASKYNENRFLSYITQIEAVEPLKIFANGAKIGFRVRSYWSDNDGLTLVGLGTAYEFLSQGNQRFIKIKEAWHELSQRVIKNVEKRGTGPLTVGGFSFNEGEKENSEWSHFPDAAFTIPRFLFTEIDGETWLSINIEVTPELDPLKTYEIIKAEVDHLLSIVEPSHQRYLSKLETSSPEKKVEWIESVNKVINQIHLGEVDKVVLSRVLDVQMDEGLPPEMLLDKLIEHRSYGFVFAFERNGDCFIGATPERLVKRDASLVYCDCLAGTEGRGKTAEEDNAMGDALLKDDKNRAEHQFVVQMIKNAMSHFANDVIAPAQPRIVKAESVQHLFTPVSGLMKNSITLFDAIEQLHPTPAMGGTPREKALSIINEIEPHKRGWYASPVGWIDEDGNGDFAVGIRSCLILRKSVRLYAGCGIVKDSDPEKEYRETEMKFRPILNALEAIHDDIPI